MQFYHVRQMAMECVHSVKCFYMVLGVKSCPEMVTTQAKSTFQHFNRNFVFIFFAFSSFYIIKTSNKIENSRYYFRSVCKVFPTWNAALPERITEPVTDVTTTKFDGGETLRQQYHLM